MSNPLPDETSESASPEPRADEVYVTENLPSETDADEPTPLTDLVEQPAKVMRIGGMIRQLLDEVKAAPLDEASRTRLRSIYEQSIGELKDGLAPELVEELERLSLPFDQGAPSESELRIAQAQLVGWLEGLFHGIQAALYAQQVQAQVNLKNMRLALPEGMAPMGENVTSPTSPDEQQRGMYL